MKNTARSRNGAREKTHFVGALVSDELTDTLEGFRGWMRSALGCRSGQETPVHITLIPPFSLGEESSTERLALSLQCAAEELIGSGLLPFDADVEGFGAFEERTVFARVLPDPRWEKLKAEISSAVRREIPSVKIDRRAFFPHLTVANRDIPPGGVALALSRFSELNLKESFRIDNIALFTRSESGTWIAEDENVVRF